MLLRKYTAAALVPFLLVVTAPAARAATCETSDIVVYGGTPAGLAAAIQAGRMGKSVTVLEPTNHVGGMMGSGLTKTDASAFENSYGGIVRSFLALARAHYGTKSTTRVYYGSGWAEETLRRMTLHAGAKIVLGQPIAAAVRSGRRVVRVETTAGRRFCAKVFVEASYEGDLLAKAGVPTILGRESRATYGEPHAGAQALGRIEVGGRTVLVDPYVKPGDPSSGLLFGVEPFEERTIGQADDRLMAFNYRLCVTARADDKVPFRKPAGYDPMLYETAARFLQTLVAERGFVTSPHFIGSGVTVEGKLDVNSNRYFSTDVWHIGRDYVLADEAGRAAIRARVRNYTEGLMWFASTDPRVPKNVRAYTRRFGWCADEFRDNGNFPRQLYVRQGRRLLGRYVLTENDLMARRSFDDSIGLGYYPMDEHGMYRTVVGGSIAEEIRQSLPGGKYEIPYRTLLPKITDMVNVIAATTISSSHVAFTSVRVEPTLMVIGQAAGAAAALAKDGRVGAVDMPRLLATLDAAGQIRKKVTVGGGR